MTAECYGCGITFKTGDRVWLMENDDAECDSCHEDRLRDDLSDTYDHGHPYILSLKQIGATP